MCVCVERQWACISLPFTPLALNEGANAMEPPHPPPPYEARPLAGITDHIRTFKRLPRVITQPDLCRPNW